MNKLWIRSRMPNLVKIGLRMCPLPTSSLSHVRALTIFAFWFLPIMFCLCLQYSDPMVGWQEGHMARRTFHIKTIWWWRYHKVNLRGVV